MYVDYHVLNDPEYSYVDSESNRVNYYIARFRRIWLEVFGDLPYNEEKYREIGVPQGQDEVRQSEEIKQQWDLRQQSQPLG